MSSCIICFKEKCVCRHNDCTEVDYLRGEVNRLNAYISSLESKLIEARLLEVQKEYEAPNNIFSTAYSEIPPKTIA